MTHRAEQAVDAIVAKIEAVSGLSASVFKWRVQSLADGEGELPAVSIGLGADSPLSDLGVDNLAYIDSLLEVPVSLVAAGDTEALLLTELLRLRSRVHVALMADVTQGLAFVVDTRYGGAEAPSISTDGSRLTGRLDTRWLVHYRMNLSDPD